MKIRLLSIVLLMVSHLNAHQACCPQGVDRTFSKELCVGLAEMPHMREPGQPGDLLGHQVIRFAFPQAAANALPPGASGAVAISSSQGIQQTSMIRRVAIRFNSYFNYVLPDG